MTSSSFMKKQFLKILSLHIWEAFPRLVGCPQTFRPSPTNTLLVDDSPSKSCLNPIGNTLFPLPWEPSLVDDDFLIGILLEFIRDMVFCGGSVSEFVNVNRFGQLPLSSSSTLYKDIHKYSIEKHCI